MTIPRTQKGIALISVMTGVKAVISKVLKGTRRLNKRHIKELLGKLIMSTNYYLVPIIPTEELEVLNKYGFEVKKLHVGKESRGLQFLFNTITIDELKPFILVSNPIDTFESMKDIITRLLNRKLFLLQDEYEVEIIPDDLFSLVEEQQSLRPHNGSWYTFDEQGFTFAEGEWF